MVFPGDNPPPPNDPFAPTPPPPGGPFNPAPIGPGPGPAPIGPSSFQPAPSSGSSTWKYILIGCLGIIVLGGIITIGSCLFLASKSGDAITGVMKLAKTEYVKQLSDDHTPEQRARFEQAYDFYAEQSKNLGLTEWATKYSDATEKLTTMTSDNTVTVEESQAWADMVLDGAPAPATGDADSGSGEGDTAPASDAGDDAGSGDAGAGDAGSDSGGSDSGGTIHKEGP